MPEGPEIRQAADQVAKAIAGRTAEAVTFAFDHLKPYEALLSGATVAAVEARGKAILTRFANGYNIYSHNQLYGQWVVRPAYDLPQTNRQLRLAIHTALKSALLYSASEIAVLHDGELDGHPFLSKLGPDLLDARVTVEQVAARLADARFRRRGFPALLLDQHFLAGLGNYLRSEALFSAALAPTLRPVDCTPDQLERLARACVELTRQSYRTKGITNDLQRVEQLKAAGYTRRAYRWQVFGRAGEPCWQCGTLIERSELGGRRLYYCPQCQSADG